MSERKAPAGIVVGTDGSEHSLVAVRWAAQAAVFRNVGLTVVHVVAESTAPASTMAQPAGRIPDEVLEPRDTDIDDVIARSVAAAADSGENIPEIASAHPHGHPASTLAGLSKTAEMIAVGHHGIAGRHRRELGPVVRGLLHHAHCPVAIVREDPAPEWRAHRPVLVGVDGSRSSKLAAEIAFEEALWRGVDLLAVHACHDAEAPPASGHRDPVFMEAAEATLTRSLSPLRDRFPAVRVHHVIRYSNPARQLLIQGERAQLVVLGSHGRGEVRGALLGSVGAAVARDARVPVIVARRH
ncbi:universal stress protein [Mycobacterium sp. Y57]|uniref:universal stress protein n=1 Tax=Mycolicibacterium xanthum TaxID=2796469 RepID=UPI001C849487|nr:universal stress protein [Mycolicibacterium xanthum]MBX7432142.1 universal stress protein [Mycolicibacterium xanthum]